MDEGYDPREWILNPVFERLQGRREIVRNERRKKRKLENGDVMIRRVRVWDETKFDRGIFRRKVIPIVKQMIKSFQMRFDNVCFSWNENCTKYEYDDENMVFSYNPTDFKALANYRLDKYLELYYLPELFERNDHLSGKYSVELAEEINNLIERLRNRDIVLTRKSFEKGTLSEFICRNHRMSLLDVFEQVGCKSYPKLMRCLQFIASIQPVTSRLESLFSVLGHSTRANLSVESLEKRLMLKLDKCGGIRKLF